MTGAAGSEAEQAHTRPTVAPDERFARIARLAGATRGIAGAAVVLVEDGRWRCAGAFGRPAVDEAATVATAGRALDELGAVPVDEPVGAGRADGSALPDDTLAEPVRNPDGAVAGALVLVVEAHRNEPVGAVDAPGAVDPAGVVDPVDPVDAAGPVDPAGWSDPAGRAVGGLPAGVLADLVALVELELAHAAIDEALAEVSRYERFVRSSTDIITVVAPDGAWLYSSPAGTRLLGYPTGYNPPGGLLDLVHPDDREVAATALLEVFAGTRDPDDTIIFRVRSHDGRVLHLESKGRDLSHDPLVGGVVISSRDVTERQELAEALEFAALHDPLTGLANRSLFFELLDRSVARAARTGAPMAVCYVDLDLFKRINDRWGHAVGDELLIAVARRLERVSRSAEVAARLGGDEFVVLCEDVAGEVGAEAARRRIAEALSEPHDISVGRVICRASVGVAVSRGDLDGAEVLRRADADLYASKEQGRSGPGEPSAP